MVNSTLTVETAAPNESFYRESFDEVRKMGWLGDGVSLKDYSQNRELFAGIEELVAIANLDQDRSNVVHMDVGDDSSKRIKIIEFGEIAREHTIVGPHVELVHFLDSRKFFAGVFGELKKKGVNLSAFEGSALVPVAKK